MICIANCLFFLVMLDIYLPRCHRRLDEVAFSQQMKAAVDLLQHLLPPGVPHSGVPQWCAFRYIFLFSRGTRPV